MPRVGKVKPRRCWSCPDALRYTVNPIKPKHDQHLLRGERLVA